MPLRPKKERDIRPSLKSRKGKQFPLNFAKTAKPSKLKILKKIEKTRKKRKHKPNPSNPQDWIEE